MEKKGFFDKNDLKFVGGNVVLAIVVVLVLLTVLIVYLQRYTQHGVEVEVNDVRGLVEAEARQVLGGLGVKKEYVTAVRLRRPLEAQVVVVELRAERRDHHLAGVFRLEVVLREERETEGEAQQGKNQAERSFHNRTSFQKIAFKYANR